MENLFEIQYQKKFPFVKVSKQNLFSIFFIALLTGVVAFLYETLLDYILKGVLCDRGFLIGLFYRFTFLLFCWVFFILKHRKEM